MKVEVDEVYCCGYVMEQREVIDTGNKKRTLIFECSHCKNAFEIDRKHIKEQPQ